MLLVSFFNASNYAHQISWVIILQNWSNSNWNNVSTRPLSSVVNCYQKNAT